MSFRQKSGGLSIIVQNMQPFHHTVDHYQNASLFQILRDPDKFLIAQQKCQTTDSFRAERLCACPANTRN
jgi:hypothetical protein